MLSRLYIENIAVIEKTEIDFTKGFNVLTGETGAGKSIVIDAISAVLGRRTSRELVRTGADSAFVSATFTDVGETTKEALKNLAIPIEDELILEREFTLSGKNICKINSRPASISVLREISRFLINIHGQHESYELMSPDLHMGYIDSYGGHSDILKEYTEVYAEYKDVCRVLNQKNSDDRDRLRRADLLKFQIDELESAEIRAGEFSELSEERNILANAQKLRELLSTASYYLKGDSGEFPGAVSLLSNACDEVSSAAEVMDSVKTLSERLGSCYYDLEDISSELNSLAESIDDNPYRLEEIEMRLDLLTRLMKKYGDSEEELLAYLENIRSELSAIESFEEDREKLLLMQSELYEKSMKIAVKLSEARRETSEKFSREVMKRMRLLDMPSAVVSVSQITGDLTDTGIDTLEFMVSTNAGEPVKPVSKVASGGELSRMMLSIKTVLSEKEPTDTLIFDEVDSGISGSAALRVGEALRDVSNSCQVLCVTHLPQIAAMAKSHYLIKKSEDKGRTYTKVIPLDTEGRVEELSRIIGGETVTETARSYAKELLKL